MWQTVPGCQCGWRASRAARVQPGRAACAGVRQGCAREDADPFPALLPSCSACFAFPALDLQHQTLLCPALGALRCRGTTGRTSTPFLTSPSLLPDSSPITSSCWTCTTTAPGGALGVLGALQVLWTWGHFNHSTRSPGLEVTGLLRAGMNYGGMHLGPCNRQPPPPPQTHTHARTHHPFPSPTHPCHPCCRIPDWEKNKGGSRCSSTWRYNKDGIEPSTEEEPGKRGVWSVWGWRWGWVGRRDALLGC